VTTIAGTTVVARSRAELAAALAGLPGTTGTPN
jgi:hypothetical protein